MKQMETIRRTVGDIEFLITPFDAFYAAGLSGELGRFFGPMLTGIIPIFLSNDDETNKKDVKELIPLVTSGFDSLQSNNVIELLKKLIINRQNVAYIDPEDGEVKLLKMDSANEIFCQDIQNMYLLAYYVIEANYSGFFEKLLAPFGGLNNLKAKMTG